MADEPRRAFRLDRGRREDARGAVDEELAHHLELRAEELVEAGWSRDEARLEAERRFGDLEATRAFCMTIQTRRRRVDARGRILDETRQDLRHALRSLGRAPGHAALVVLTLAFGIAANTAVFSLMNPYFFRALPFEAPEGLAHLAQVDPVTGWHMDRFSLPILRDWEEASQGVAELAAYGYGGVNVTGPEGAEGVNLGRVSANLLDVLGVRPALGRGFRPEDGGAGAEPVVLLDHGFWERRYVADPEVVGRAILLDGVAHTVVGVMPSDFVFPFNRVVLWTPIRESATAARDRAPWLAVARMSPGWSRDRLDAELTRIQVDLAREHPDADGRWTGVTVLPLRQALNFGWDVMALTFGLLLGAVACVLALACVNVASLTLARATTRHRDLSVRAALGATRGRVVRQLLAESTLLALAGGALGTGLAWVLTSAVGPLLPPDLFRVGEASLDGRVLLFTLGVTLATPLVFGLAPALVATRRDPATGLKAGGRGPGDGAASRARSVLVAVQVALAVVLLTGAGLMVRSYGAVRDVDVGFAADRLLYAEVRPPESGYDADAVRAWTREAVARAGRVPGVVSASATLHLPLNHETTVGRFQTPDGSGTPPEAWPTGVANRAWPGYFETMGIPVLSGRGFREADDATGPPVVVVSQPLAAAHWPGEDPVGRTLLVGDPADPLEVTVVGVVGAVLHEELAGGPPRPQLYRPVLQAEARRHFVVVRTRNDPATLVGPVREALAALDPDLSLSVAPMESVLRESRLQWSLGSAFLAVLGAGALLLATLGVYGLVSFSVSRRGRELGVRMALGASPRAIRIQVVRDGVALTGAGLVLGLAGALLLGRTVASALYGVSPFDPGTLAAVVFLFLAVAASAALVPAVRASRTDPMRALRSD